jgi:hypothetical protein
VESNENWELVRGRDVALLLCEISNAAATDFESVSFALVPQDQYGCGPGDATYTFDGAAVQDGNNVKLICDLSAAQTGSLFVHPGAGFARYEAEVVVVKQGGARESKLFGEVVVRQGVALS